MKRVEKDKVEFAVIWLIAIIIFAIFLTNDIRAKRIAEGRFREEEEISRNVKLYTDRDTGVQYIISKNDIEVVINHDGTPYIANGWRDYDG